jgi:ATP-dependent protease ClpP protease subunit
MNRQQAARRVQNLQPRAGWFRIVRNDAGGPVRVDIYDDIGGGGWFDDGMSATAFAAALAEVSGDLEVHINSPGGDVWDAVAIYNAIAQYPGGTTTITDGLAASAASFVAQAGKKRLVAPGSMTMIHDAITMDYGNAADLRKTADLLDKASDNIASIYAAHSGKLAAAWREAMRQETWYTADETVAAGLADGLTERPADQAALAAAASFDLSIFGRVPAQLRSSAPRRVLGAESMPILDKAIAIHHTATVDTAWDGPAAVAAMPAEYADLHACHAWQSADADSSSHAAGDDDADDKKGNFKFPHHETKGGPANLAGCRNGLARLSSADIPAADEAGVKAHLQAHLDDGSKSDAGNHADSGPGLDPAELMTALKGAFA